MRRSLERTLKLGSKEPRKLDQPVRRHSISLRWCQSWRSLKRGSNMTHTWRSAVNEIEAGAVADQLEHQTLEFESGLIKETFAALLVPPSVWPMLTEERLSSACRPDRRAASARWDPAKSHRRIPSPGDLRPDDSTDHRDRHYGVSVRRHRDGRERCRCPPTVRDNRRHCDSTPGTGVPTVPARAATWMALGERSARLVRATDG